MVIVVLVVLGLCLGSFVNALVWRVHEQAGKKKAAKSLSVLNGRSMCPHCQHELKALDLIPVISWLALRGKCRYCSKPISAQYPVVEVVTALLFVGSYIWWPESLHGLQTAMFAVWLLVLTGLMALLVYDLHWYLLPDRIMGPLSGLAGLMALLYVVDAAQPLHALLNVILAIAVGGGIFYVLFQVSGGKWIGGGDVKLGWLLGLVVQTPAKALLMIFLATFLGSLVSLPLLLSKRLKRTSVVPFGPFLIAGAILTVLFGAQWIDWYRSTFINL